ncbi:MAG: SsrA-binding protein [Candidatus Wallbacteria bacterium HGW-Wallbacteria-1]|jgi:SsrA-binding protein|uniref:SsrA-binding protein n=1 Tax=Candidatus Wallbacteria bacterium HGW-Wallbacteria-1 TaxID=2013854 RepID=A0A2N1PTW8_9BACT|nr:MAG: SsrA-binding protein [Candidatus Wallbacteria bacterium HGW-Wallbacteria-1]
MSRDNNAKSGIKVVAKNRKASHDFELLQRFEAGLVLLGTEVKSLRAGKVSFQDTYGRFVNGEMFLVNLHISPYDHGGYSNHEPMRPRKLLLSSMELRKILTKVMEKGCTIVPTMVYFRGQYAKIEIALARGKKLYDKRDDITKRDQKRQLEREFKGARV